MTNSIIETYKKQSGVIMRNITKKYTDLIEEVKYYISNDWDKFEAINFVLFNEYDFMFSDNENDRTLLNSWMQSKIN